MTLQLKVGHSYRRRDGGREDIFTMNRSINYPYLSKSGIAYAANGLAVENNYQADLIREWPTEPQQPLSTEECKRFVEIKARKHDDGRVGLTVSGMLPFAEVVKAMGYKPEHSVHALSLRDQFGLHIFTSLYVQKTDVTAKAVWDWIDEVLEARGNTNEQV